MNNYKEAAQIIKKSKQAIALTGAGVSVESGIPDFRSSGGLWELYDPAIYANIENFYRMPEKIWEMIFAMVELTETARPNPGHEAMARMEELGYLKAIITQNIDNLHQEGGSKHVIEYHGNASRLECQKCGKEYANEDFDFSLRVPPRCECEAILKPTVIFFGEAIPVKAMTESQILAENADVVIVAGTSAVVYPAAGIPLVARQSGAHIIECNIEKTGLTDQYTDIFIQGPTGETLPELVRHLEQA